MSALIGCLATGIGVWLSHKPEDLKFLIGLLPGLALIFFGEAMGETGGRLGMVTVPEGTPGWLLKGLGFLLIWLPALVLLGGRFA